MAVFFFDSLVLDSVSGCNAETACVLGCMLKTQRFNNAFWPIKDKGGGASRIPARGGFNKNVPRLPSRMPSGQKGGEGVGGLYIV